MDHNPLRPELAALAASLSDLQKKRARLKKDLAWHKKFDREATFASLEPTQARCDELAIEAQSVSDELEALTSLTAALEDEAQLGWNPFYWFSEERGRAKARLEEHESAVRALQFRQDEVAHESTNIEKQLKGLQRSISKFDAFDRALTMAELEGLVAELTLVELARDDLADRVSALDRELAAPVGELERLLAERGGLKRRMTDVEERRDTLHARLQGAEGLDAAISRALTSYDRAMIHQDCERRFGNSSPRAVMRDLRADLRNVDSDRRTVERHLVALDRDVEKLRTRIKKIGQRGSRKISGIVVDGSNLCYQQTAFIGLAALRPLCSRLAQSFNVTVVFDASIRHDLGVRDTDLATMLPGTTVHVVASHSDADETILDVAADEFIFVLSNDRFAEYPDKAAVRGQRVLRHHILNGRVLVQDLAIDIAFISPD
ncbi:MAG TPA: hypothetical protein VHC43_11820 [Mycobacteriales bacterium]|nr:hypothetical protein [Mycobacteriales bacterium]